MAKRVVTTMFILLSAAMVANCGDDSSGSSGGDGGVGPGGSGTIEDAGEPSTGATTSMGGTGSGDAGSGNEGGTGATTPGGAPPVLGGAGGAGGEAGFDCPQDIEDYPTLITEAICGKRVECCENDVDACSTEVSAAMAEVFPGLAQAKADGAVAEDCGALEACLAAIAGADCSEWPKELPDTYGLPVDEPACRGVIKGLLEPEDSCVASYQCDHGICSGDACAALVPDGDSCASGYCELATSYCGADDICMPREPNGTACTSDDECASRICDVDTDKCVAPDPVAACEFVPDATCSIGRGPTPGSLGWSALVAALVVGAGARRRRRRA